MQRLLSKRVCSDAMPTAPPFGIGSYQKLTSAANIIHDPKPFSSPNLHCNLLPSLNRQDGPSEWSPRSYSWPRHTATTISTKVTRTSHQGLWTRKQRGKQTYSREFYALNRLHAYERPICSLLHKSTQQNHTVLIAVSKRSYITTALLFANAPYILAHQTPYLNIHTTSF